MREVSRYCGARRGRNRRQQECIRESVPELQHVIEWDPEAGSFFAYAEDRDPEELRAAFARAERAGIEFHD
jgi:hypothetical protein